MTVSSPPTYDAGVALGFFIARKYMMSYLKKNPPI
ncbi:YneF family protein, partial [Bacillus inaquosorum]